MRLKNRNPKEEQSGYVLILGQLGKLMILIGALNFLPLLVLPFYPEEVQYAHCFVLPGAALMLIGYLQSLIIKGHPRGTLETHHPPIVVVAIWIMAIISAAMPFLVSGEYNFTQAVFEATSGFSTTGLTVVDVSTAPHIFLMHRSLTLFFGGVGLVLVMTSVFADSSGMKLYAAEGHENNPLPNLWKSARLILIIYLGYIIGGAVMFCVFGMNAFDAINHSIAAVATGGFSTRSESIGYYNSVGIEAVAVVLMLLGCTNFVVHTFLLQGKLRKVFRHCETKMAIFTLAVAIPVVIGILLKNTDLSGFESVEHSVFQVVSALSGTGFQTVDSFSHWPAAAALVLVVLMIMGGSTGSTAGGIKLFRCYVGFKEVLWYSREELSEKRVVRVNQVERLGEKTIIDDKLRRNINLFIIVYISILAIGTFIYTLYGYSIQSSLFEFASALGTVGLSVGITGPDANPVIMWTSICGMFVGRLEIFAVLFSIISLGRDIKNVIIRK